MQPRLPETEHHSALAQAQAMQDVYQQWQALLPRLFAAQKEWQQARDLLAQLTGYYFSDVWMRHYDAYAALSEQMQVAADSEHVLAQDTIYDAIGQERQLALAWMRLGLAVLDEADAADCSGD